MITEVKPAGYGTFIGLSWQAAFRAMRRAPLVFVAALIGLTVIGVGFGLLDRLIGKIPSSGIALQIGSGAAEFLAALVRLALVSLALAPVALVVHRLIILDELPGFRRIGLYAQWLFGFLVFEMAIQIPQVLFGTGSFALKWLMIGIVAVMVLRSALIFPAIAADVPGGTIKEWVEESWRLARGHLRRMFVVWLVAALPVIVAAAVLLRSPAGPDAVATPKPGLGIVASLIGALLAVAATAISAAVTSWVYLWALDHPAVEAKP